MSWFRSVYGESETGPPPVLYARREAPLGYPAPNKSPILAENGFLAGGRLAIDLQGAVMNADSFLSSVIRVQLCSSSAVLVPGPDVRRSKSSK
jgi:hypothetical protein